MNITKYIRPQWKDGKTMSLEVSNKLYYNGKNRVKELFIDPVDKHRAEVGKLPRKKGRIGRLGGANWINKPVPEF